MRKRPRVLAVSYPILEVCDISKWFGATCALRDVSLELMPGEVHVLAGENGAGKSTLIRILSGVQAPDHGELRLAGNSLRVKDPVEARKSGIATIHQELSLVPDMSVVDNLFLGERGSFFAPIRRTQRVLRARELLARFGLDVDPSVWVGKLPLGTRQLIEIARALGGQSRVVIFDEPTSALTHLESEQLFSHIQTLREQGAAVLYISHRMEEIYRLADRISVLRDGRKILTKPASELPRNELVRAMLGQDLTSVSEQRAQRAEPLLKVEQLSFFDSKRRVTVLDRVSFQAARGEILGIAGLQGSGASELVHALFGSLGPLTQGRVEFAGMPLRIHDPRASIRDAIVLLPGDRALGIFSELSVADNVALASLAAYTRFGWLKRSLLERAVNQVIERLPIVAPSLLAPIRALSGGNQQKAMFLRCLLCRPKLLLCDEATRGVDIRAKSDIYRIVRELAAEGVSVVWATSDLEELLELSDRVLVMARGRVSLELERASFSRDAVLAAAMGGGEQAA